eukprot:11361256-Heterocapsa_arctica.AAC.1
MDQVMENNAGGLCAVENENGEGAEEDLGHDGEDERAYRGGSSAVRPRFSLAASQVEVEDRVRYAPTQT